MNRATVEYRPSFVDPASGVTDLASVHYESYILVTYNGEKVRNPGVVIMVGRVMMPDDAKRFAELIISVAKEAERVIPVEVVK